MSWIADLAGSGISAAVNWFGGERNRDTQMQIANQNIAMQREFAQNGIRWRVQDAIQAGLHPLIGAGSQPTNFSPVSVGGDMGGGMSAAGQDIGRAVKAGMTALEREDEDVEKARKLQLEKGSLENDLLRTELRSKSRREASQLGPPMPGSISSSGRVPLPRPGPARMPSGEAVREDDLKQTIEDQPSPESGRPYGFQMPYNRLFGSAQAFEDRYGDSEIAQTIKFLINTGADLYSFLNTDPYAGKRGPSSAARRRKSRPWGE